MSKGIFPDIWKEANVSPLFKKDDPSSVRAIFCDVSKAFDRVWHKGLLYKLKHKGIDETLLQWLASYISNRKQRVVIPGACSEWVAITALYADEDIFRFLCFVLRCRELTNVMIGLHNVRLTSWHGDCC